MSPIYSSPHATAAIGLRRLLKIGADMLRLKYALIDSCLYEGDGKEHPQLVILLSSFPYCHYRANYKN